MRIRQVRPEYWSDPVTARLPVDVQLTYIALWCVADDDGWLRWDIAAIGALVCPYLSVRQRERRLEKAREALVATRRLIVMECGCARIPTLPQHQKIGGNKSFTARSDHYSHGPVQTRMDLYPGKVSNVKVGNGTVRASADSPAGGGSPLRAAAALAGVPADITAGDDA